MKLEHGHFYEDGHGSKRGPIRVGHEFCWIKGNARYADPEWNFDGTPTEHGLRIGMTEKDALIAEWTDEPRSWGDWKSAKGWEKDGDWLSRIKPGYLQILMPDGEQRTINLFTDLPKGDFAAFRIKPEPVVETVELTGVALTGKGATEFIFSTNRHFASDTHCLMLPKKDGELVTGTFTDSEGNEIRLEEIQ